MFLFGNKKKDLYFYEPLNERYMKINSYIPKNVESLVLYTIKQCTTSLKQNCSACVKLLQ